MKRFLLPTFILLSVAGGLPVSSVAANETLNPLVVTASRIAEDTGRTSADVTVIDRQQIESSQAATVLDLLRSQAGMDVETSGGPGKSSFLYLRGSSSGQVLVLIDGARVSSTTTGGFDWSSLTTLNIERIEIVRGPQSTLYGSDAMGGVVQIFTRKGSGTPKVELGGEYAGRYGDGSGHASVSGATDSGIHYSLAGEARRSRGFSVAANGTEADHFRFNGFSGRIGMPVGEGEIELTGRFAHSENGLDGGFPFGDVLNFTSSNDQSSYGLKGSYPLNDYWESSLALAQFDEKLVLRDPVNITNNADITSRIQRLSWQNSLDFDAFSLLAGFDMNRDKGVNGSQNIDVSRTQKAGFATVGFHHEMIDLHAGLRVDNNDTISNKTTYRVGGAVFPMQGLKLTANYGTGFKLPSINDLYWPASAWSSGNANLKPEESKGWDVGIAYQRQYESLSVDTSIVWFTQDFTNLISWAETAPWFWQPSNVGKATTRGLEISTAVKYDIFSLRGNWTILDAKNSTDGTWLNRRSKESGSFTAGISLHGFDGEVQWYVVGPCFAGVGNTSPMAGYQRTDVRLAYRVNNMIRVHLRAENITDEVYEEITGYGVAGRTVYTGLSLTF